MFRSFVVALLRIEATLVLRKYQPTIIGVTGSVGKTSTKEATWMVLSSHERVAKNPKSYNSDLGVPLAILGLETAWHSSVGWAHNLIRGFLLLVRRVEYPTSIVLEMGVDHPGDLDRLLSWVHPKISVVTAIGEVPVHVEFFGGPEEVALEKAKIVRVLPDDGYAILNADDPYVERMRSMTRAHVLMFGFGPQSDVRASRYHVHTRLSRPTGISFELHYRGEKASVHVDGVVGRQVVYALLAAAAVSFARGGTIVATAENLAGYRSERGRLNLIKGKKKTLILDDTYNASPIAVEAALDALASIPAKRRIVVLGDMLELGKFTAQEHKRIGEEVLKFADLLIAVGMRSKSMERAHAWFSTSAEAGEYLDSMITEGDIILIKGSQGMRMERVVKAIMIEPEQAKALLVRQEAYWQKQ